MIVVRKETAPNEGPDIEPNSLTSTTFKIENFCGKNMYQQYKDEKFCDVTLAAGERGKRISVHRLILCGANENFEDFFRGEQREKQKNFFQIEGIAEDALLSVIEFCYTGEIKINQSNVDNLLVAAQIFHFKQLEQKCSEYYLTPANCLRYLKIVDSDGYDFDTFKEMVKNYAMDHFIEVVRCDEFSHIEGQHLKELLSNDNLNVDSEEDVFEALAEWVEYDLSEREASFPELIRVVRVKHLRKSFLLSRIFNWISAFDDAFLYMEISNIILLELSSKDNPPARTSTQFGRIFAIGGSDYDVENNVVSIEKYCPRLNEWTIFHDVPGLRTEFSVVQVKNEVIILGGRITAGVPTATVESLNMNTLATRELEPMMIARWSLTTAITNGYIYAVGGQNYGCLNSVERYDIKANTWTQIAPMSEARGYPACVIFMNSLFVIGGQKNTKIHATVEYYIPCVNKWVSASSLNIERTSPQAGVANDTIYVCGGVNHLEILPTIERYDHEQDSWTMMTFTMKIPRFSFGASFHSKSCYAIGGKTKKPVKSNTYEVVNLVTGKRSTLQPMLFERRNVQIVHLHFAKD